MPLHSAKPAERPRLPRRKRLPSVESQLQRFHRRQRMAVAEIARRHPRLADLALSFPALLFTLAARRPGVDSEAVLAGVIAGRPLPELAAAAKLPLWTRKLPPETFRYPIPHLPDGEVFQRRIGNHVPKRQRFLHRWLWTIAIAGYWGGPDFAIWCAKHTAADGKRLKEIPTGQLALWAWHSLRPELSASQAIEQRWQPEIGYDSAVTAASGWIRNLVARASPVPAARDVPFLTSGECDGFTFVPLTTRCELEAEADALQNCLRDYDLDPPGFGYAVYSVRKDSERVAALCVRYDSYAPIPHIIELKAKCNDEAPRNVWIAAAKWLASHDLADLAAQAPDAGRQEMTRQQWQSLWLPYWKDRKYRPRWLPFVPEEGWRWQLANAR